VVTDWDAEVETGNYLKPKTTPDRRHPIGRGRITFQLSGGLGDAPRPEKKSPQQGVKGSLSSRKV